MLLIFCTGKYLKQGYPLGNRIVEGAYRHLVKVMPLLKTPFMFTATSLSQPSSVVSQIGYLPYFLVTFREMGLRGFGLNRSKAHLATVEAYLPETGDWREIYNGSDGLVKNLPALWSFDQLCAEAHNLPKESLTIHFLTPTRLVYKKQVVRKPEFVIAQYPVVTA